ncbi:sugar kinase [Shimazuella sp. AN120528]|uniref:sugar kinase n=1 Tax=Shimazuella soli TaxID=1892854 RepID=UPI001F10AF5B|nr:sugar kinase [Shimazuella soli]MCH5585802.1 sugar kinase [Shimazuella soli]
MNYEKIVIVTRETRLDGLVKRYNTRSQARFYVNQSLKQASRSPSGETTQDFSLFEQEHNTYLSAVESVKEQFRENYKLQVIDRSFLPNYIFSPQDIVVTIGIDGLVVNTAKYLSGQPLIAINPDPEHIDGILLPFQVRDAYAAVENVFHGRETYKKITMAEAKLNDGQTLRAFNDLFIGAATHVSARYRLGYHLPMETQSSSGIIVSTGAGSTGWISSVINMANGVYRSYQPKSEQLTPPKIKWEDESLLFAVREPFVSKTTTAQMVTGSITKHKPLVIESQMEQNGVIFSDGVENDFLMFNAGMTATITIGEQKTNLVVKS